MTYKEFLDNNIKKTKELGKEKEAVKLLFLELIDVSQNDYLLKSNFELDNISYYQEKMDLYLYQNIPVQYILGYAYFYGLKFSVNKNVLIPRFDTEILVDKVINYALNNKLKIIDIGTGSGCIAISLKKNLKESIIKAIDISKEALAIAKENAEKNNVDIEFIESDLLDNINEQFDIIVSNPPYISKEDYVEKIVFDNEPHLALFSENDGMYYYEKIVHQSLKKLKENGAIFFEIGYNQKEKIQKIIYKYYPNAIVEVDKDLNGNDRVVSIYKK